MSTAKRKVNVDEAPEADHEQRSASPRKRSRLSSFKNVDGDRKRIKLGATPVNDHKAKSAPVPLLWRQDQPIFVAEGARRNKSTFFGDPRLREASIPHSPISFPYDGSPKLFDVSPDLLDAIAPADGEMPFWNAEHAAFIKSAAGLKDANWVGKRPLGFGTFGTAGLWERLNEDNDLIEQIVIKESKTVPIERWAEEIHEEVKMMRRMNNTDCQAIPKLKAYKRYPHVRKHRIYMAYCPYGDLAMLNMNYKRFRAYLPEPFLWHIFNKLVEVAEAMQYGPYEGNWDYQIVHRDLKPGNIFLGLEDDSSGFPSYPVAKTGDWGLATKIKHDDTRNPLGLRDTGTRVYFAPEQRILLSGPALRAEMVRHLDGTSPLRKLSSHTNIWGIGAIMFELLTHEAVVLYSQDDEWATEEAFFDIPNLRNPPYSDALTELIRLCLMPEPWDRPSVEELQLRIGTRCQKIAEEYAANPSLRQKERLYYKGSEINQMPPGNWHYWNPLREYVPRPSETPDSLEIKNPFTEPIVYPPFPLLDEDEGGGEVHEGEGIRNPIVISDDSSSNRPGNYVDNPVTVSDNDEEDGSDEQETGSEGSSNDSDARRKAAIKTLPGML